MSAALGLGAALAMLALTTNTQLLLPIICAINVVEIGSVALQMIVFRATGRRRRLFRLSPIHHHFEIGGWAETKVIVRFWLLAGMAVAVALAIFLADFTDQAAALSRAAPPRAGRRCSTSGFGRPGFGGR